MHFEKWTKLQQKSNAAGRFSACLLKILAGKTYFFKIPNELLDLIVGQAIKKAVLIDSKFTFSLFKWFLWKNSISFLR